MGRSRPCLPRRREVLKGIVGGLASTALPLIARSARAAAGLATTTLTNELTLVSGAGGNVLVLETNAGQVLVDSGAAAFEDALLATLGELPGGQVAAVFNTHWHRDQVGANATLGGRGARIFAHEKTRIRLKTGHYVPAEDRYEQPLPPAALPTETFHTNATAMLGEHRIEYGYLISAHTDGDIYVAFPDLDVIAVGDVVSSLRDPVFDWFGGGWLGGRVDALALLLERSGPDTRFVPSYGPAVGRTEVQAAHAMMLELFERMVEHVRLGESAEDMLEAGVLDGLGRSFENPYALLYDLNKGFWAHHNKLMPDIV